MVEINISGGIWVCIFLSVLVICMAYGMIKHDENQLEMALQLMDKNNSDIICSQLMSNMIYCYPKEYYCVYDAWTAEHVKCHRYEEG